MDIEMNSDEFFHAIDFAQRIIADWNKRLVSDGFMLAALIDDELTKVAERLARKGEFAVDCAVEDWAETVRAELILVLPQGAVNHLAKLARVA